MIVNPDRSVTVTSEEWAAITFSTETLSTLLYMLSAVVTYLDGREKGAAVFDGLELFGTKQEFKNATAFSGKPS